MGKGHRISLNLPAWAPPASLHGINLSPHPVLSRTESMSFLLCFHAGRQSVQAGDDKRTPEHLVFHEQLARFDRLAPAAQPVAERAAGKVFPKRQGLQLVQIQQGEQGIHRFQMVRRWQPDLQALGGVQTENIQILTQSLSTSAGVSTTMQSSTRARRNFDFAGVDVHEPVVLALCVVGAEHDAGLQHLAYRPGNSSQEPFEIRAEDSKSATACVLFLILLFELGLMAGKQALEVLVPLE